MSVASQIMAYIEQHGKATRPELQRELDLHKKAVGSAMLKLAEKGFVVETGETERLPRKRASFFFTVGPNKFTQEAFTRGDKKIGRPARSVDPENAESSDALTLAMNALFGRRTDRIPQGQTGRIYAQDMSVKDELEVV